MSSNELSVLQLERREWLDMQVSSFTVGDEDEDAYDPFILEFTFGLVGSIR